MGSGTVAIHELVDGLRRLRGEPRRSDIVKVDLMVRSMQQDIKDIRERVLPLSSTRAFNETRPDRTWVPTEAIVERLCLCRFFRGWSCAAEGCWKIQPHPYGDMLWI